MEEREQPKFCKVKIMHAMGVIGLIQLTLQTFSIYFYPTIAWKVIALGLTLGMLLIGCFLFSNMHLSHLHLYVLFSVFYSMYLIIIILFVFLNNYNELNCFSSTLSPLSTPTTTSSPCTEQSISLFFIIASTINMFLSFIQLRFCSALRLFLKNSTQPPRANRPFSNRHFPPRYSQCSTSHHPLPSLGKPPSYSFSVATLDVTTLEESPSSQTTELPPTYDNVVTNEEHNNLNEN